MSEGVLETYYSIIYRLTPECPSCNVDLDKGTEHRDRFGADKNIYHIVKCPGCGTELELVISRQDPIYITIRITPVDEQFP